MSTPILTTKLYIPRHRPKIVFRPRLLERLNEGRTCRLTLISAPAGFGKTTLVSEWIAACGQSAAWLSLDEEDRDPMRFLAYLIAALQTLDASIGEGMVGALQSPQSPSTEAILTALLNEIASIPNNVILVLDDYHRIYALPADTSPSVDKGREVDDVLNFLLDHLPPQMHMVIATREDPNLPLARLRARGLLTELRADDLRFTPAEAAEFLNTVMRLNLSAQDVSALESRTEGWIAGLQLAGLALQGTISMQGIEDTGRFITTFTGSHRFVLDYLVEEVLHQQPEHIHSFLLRTSILDRLCGPLCEAVTVGAAETANRSQSTSVMREPVSTGQATLEYLERANLFIVPLDNERHWYRYHHLWGSFLRQRLQHMSSSSAGDARNSVNDLHIRASRWYEANDLALEAFHHAAAANDIERADRLIESKGMPAHLRGAADSILNWLESLPKPVKDAHPALWVKSATFALTNGQITGVEENLQAAEAALIENALAIIGPEGVEPVPTPDEAMNAKTHEIVGQIAAARATLRLTQYQIDKVFVQARRALEYLPPGNLPSRFAATWTLAFAQHLTGDRAVAFRTYTEAVVMSRVLGDDFSMALAISSLGQALELDNQLHAAAENYQNALTLYSKQPQPNVGEVHLGLARIFYEWNELQAAEQHGRKSLELTRQYDRMLDRFILSEVFLARLKMTLGDVSGAAEMLARTMQSVRRRNFVCRLPEVAAAQVFVLLRQDRLTEAQHLAELYELPLCQARVSLAQSKPSSALAILNALRRQVEERGWQDERLKVMAFQAIALKAHGEKEKAIHVLRDVLTLAEFGGFIRLFADEGPLMAQLLSDAAEEGTMSDYIVTLLAACEGKKRHNAGVSSGTTQTVQPLLDPLSERELEVLRLVAQGLSNNGICERLFLALPTVKGHNRKIFEKLNVKRRTEAVARARELGLL